VKCTHLYTDAHGESQIGEIDISVAGREFAPLTPPILLSEPETAARIIFATIPPGWEAERHKAPHRQYFLQLTGIIEVEVGGDMRVRTGPGEITFIEDVDGSGHATRVVGDEPVTGAFIQLPE
jgi:quercetin dioxygenase-like cupin family protein